MDNEVPSGRMTSLCDQHIYNLLASDPTCAQTNHEIKPQNLDLIEMLWPSAPQRFENYQLNWNIVPTLNGNLIIRLFKGILENGSKSVFWHMLCVLCILHCYVLVDTVWKRERTVRSTYFILSQGKIHFELYEIIDFRRGYLITIQWHACKGFHNTALT